MPSQVLKSTPWLLLGWLTASIAQAAVYTLPPPETDVIGQVKVVYATKDDTLLDIPGSGWVRWATFLSRAAGRERELAGAPAVHTALEQ